MYFVYVSLYTEMIYITKGRALDPCRVFMERYCGHLSKNNRKYTQVILCICKGLVTGPGVDGAVLQTASSFTDSFSRSWVVKICLSNLHSQTGRARELKLCEEIHIPPPVTCQVSHVTCNVSHITFPVSGVICYMERATCHMTRVTIFSCPEQL